MNFDSVRPVHVASEGLVTVAGGAINVDVGVSVGVESWRWSAVVGIVLGG